MAPLPPFNLETAIAKVLEICGEWIDDETVCQY
jgi:hypothetical protein